MSRLAVERVESDEAFRRLEGEWRALLCRSASDAFFLSWDWVSTWWEVFGPRFSLRVLVARDSDGAACGIAPFMVGSGPGRLAGGMRHLMFIGQQGDTGSEYLDLILAHGREDQAVEAFCHHLMADPDWDLAYFQAVLVEAPGVTRLVRALASLRFRAEQLRLVHSPFTSLPGSWDQFLGARSRHFRKHLQQQWKLLSKEGPVQVVRVERADDLDSAIDQLIELNRLRWGDLGESFRTEDYIRFHRLLSRRLLERGALVFFFLEVGGRRAGVRYDFSYGQKLWCFQGGWRPEYQKASIGMLLVAKGIELAIQAGCGEYDFLAGDAAYKRRWSNGERQLVDIAIPRTWRARTVALARRVRRYFDRAAAPAAPEAKPDAEPAGEAEPLS